MDIQKGRQTVLKSLRTGVAMAALAVGTLAGVEAVAQSYSFNSVQIDGNRRVEDGTILTYAGIARGQRLSAGQLNDAIQQIRASGLFESVTATPRGGTLVIEVVEKPTISDINFEGNSVLSDSELAPLISSRTRRVFDQRTVEADTDALAKAYADAGRVSAVVTPRIIRRSDNRVDLVFEVVENGLTEIQRIGFAGNRTFSDRRLRGILQTKQAGILRAIIQSDTFVADRIAFDEQVLTDFYRSRGYVDFEVRSVDASVNEERNGVRVTFNVVEGQQFRVGSVGVISEHPSADQQVFDRVVRLRRGTVYSPTKIEADIARIERKALREGVNFVRVEPRITRNDRDLTLDIDYVITQGQKVFIERIDIEGNTTTLDRVVRNRFRVVEGDPFNPRQVRESADRIRALGYFGNADVQAREGTQDDQVIIDVDVSEQPTGSLTFGANYSTSNGPGLIVNFKERNFLGRGQLLNFGLSTGERNRNFNFAFEEPNALGRDLRLGLQASYTTTNNDNALYDTTRANFSPSLAFPVSDNGRLRLYYRYAFTDITDVNDSASGIIKREASEGGIGTHALGYTFTWDTLRTGSREDDWRVRLSFGQELGRGGNETQFVKTSASATAQTRVLREDVTLRATVEGGFLHYTSGNSRVTDRYLLGSRVMRGFKPGGIGPRDAETGDALGGNKYAVARLEAEFPIGLPEEYGISGGLFVDHGGLWDVGNTSGGTVLYDEFSARTVVGASIFWTTPIGPLRFNFTEAVKAEEKDQTNNFELTISTEF